MLDVMRKHSRSFIIYIFFGIIIAVFVVNFGPQSAGCATETTHAGKVAGRPITTTLFNYALSVSGIRSSQASEPEMVYLRGMVMDQLLVREVLAEEARRLGFRISDKEVDDMIVKGRFLALGQPQPLIRGDDGKFDYSLFSRFVRYQWGLTVKKFKEEQQRELLAEKMRNLLRTSIKVSESEALADYVHRGTEVQLGYVRFSPSTQRGAVEIDAAKIKTFITANKQRIEEHFQANKSAYERLPKQVRLQVIHLGTTAGQDRAAVRQKADALLARLRGGESFDKVARAESEDAETRNAGGLLGWRNEDSAGLDPAVDKAVAKLKAGQLSGVIEGKEAFFIVKVLGRREGDITLAEAQEEIAEDLLRVELAIAEAKKVAQGFIDRARAGEKLEEMFSSTDAADSDGSQEDKEEDGEGEAARAEGAAATLAGKGERSPLKLATTSFFSRSGRDLIPGIGISKELNDIAFRLKVDEVAEKPLVVAQMVYLVTVKDRREPDMEEWARRKEDFVEEYQSRKWVEKLRHQAFELCQAATLKKNISVNSAALVTAGYQPEKNAPPLPAYTPCDSLKPQALSY